MHGFDDLDLAALHKRRGIKWSYYGQDLLPAWVADMDFALAPPIAQALTAQLATSDVGYPALDESSDYGLGRPFALRALQRYGWQLDPSLCEALCDVVQGIYTALWTLTQPGDGVIIQPPVYPPFFSAIRETQRSLLENPLTPTPTGYALDLNQLEVLAKGGAKALLLCHPHNPTGRAFAHDDLLAMAHIAERYNLLVLSDEIHADLVYAPNTHIPFASVSPYAAARTVTFTAASKAFNIAGLRCALAQFGSSALRDAFLKVPRHMRGAPSAPGLVATLAAYQQGDTWLANLLTYLDGNRLLVRDFVEAELPGVVHHMPQATYLAWLDCTAKPNAHAHFVQHGKVAPSAGEFFGAAYANFVRLNFATSRSVLTLILERMAEAWRL